MENSIIGIIGLGYVGFPLACLMSKKYKVVGFDLSKRRIEGLLTGHDETLEVDDETLRHALDTNLTLTSDIEDLRQCNIYIVAVPTPVDDYHNPDLTPLISASREVGHVLKKGDIVIYESTVYPGVTEDVCVPVLAETSGLKFNEDFFAGYSPERINPGDKKHTVENIVKITSGSTPETADKVDALYNSVLLNGTYRAQSIKVAEAAKVVENTQRDVNIAFINEAAMIFNTMGICVNDVINAAASKWNFLPFRPGLVGGHCIGVDPYYLIQRAELDGLHPRLISEARYINDHMGHYVARRIIEHIIDHNWRPSDLKLLLCGFTFKPDCPDIRNTKVIDVYKILQKHIGHIDIIDPHADPERVKAEYDVDIYSSIDDLPSTSYDIALICVPHKEFKSIDWKQMLSPEGFISAITPPETSSDTPTFYL